MIFATLSNAQTIALIVSLIVAIAVMFLTQTIWITRFLSFGWRHEPEPDDQPTQEIPRPEYRGPG